MELLNPAGLWTLLGLGPLVVLYILKIRRQRLRVASTWLWSAAQRDLLARSPFKRLTPQIPLFLQALALIALALALSRPATRGRAVMGDHLALIVDVSASMSARDASGKTRLELAKSAAATVVDSLAPGTDVMVLEAGRDARIASPLERDRRRLRQVLETISGMDVEGDLGASVALAVDRLRQLGGERRILVFTDGALASPQALANVALPTEVVQVGTPIDNVAIIRVDVRSGTDPSLGTDQVQAFAMLANFGLRPRDVFVTLREENASDVLASRRILLQPGERAPVVLTFNPAPADIGQGLVVEVSPHDAMPVDDVAYGRVPPGAGIAVVVATPGKKGSPWVERALAADPKVELFAASADNLQPTELPDGALVVVQGACPQSLPAGDVLVIDPPQGKCLGATVGAATQDPAITSWANADPRFRFVNLDGVYINRGHLIEVESPRHELVHTRNGTVIADVSAPGRTMTLLGFDVGDSNWPLKASFVLFMRNVVESARTRRAHGVESPGRAGEPVRLSVPSSVQQVEVEGPGPSKQQIPARSGLAVLPATTRAGIYFASWQQPSPGSVRFAVNLTSERESDVRPKPLPVDTKTTTVIGGGQLPQAHTEWSWLMAVVALAAVLADIWFLTRLARVRSMPAPMQPKVPERRPA